MLFELAGNTVDIDIEKTKAMYIKLPYVWQQCICSACRNFEERLSAMKGERFKLFHEMGINLAKCQYLWAYEPGEKPSTQKYCLRYPLAGKAVELDENSGWETIEKGLLARFAVFEGELSLILDWELKWTRI